jgi:hypothetical protein
MENTKTDPVNFADCYVLSHQRSRSFITSFLDTFLPNRQEATSRYEIPQFSESPDFLFTNADELITYLEQHPNELHAIYWLNKDASPLRGAMCIFTSDGQVILGLYCETLRPDIRNEQFYLERLMAFCNSTDGLIEYEQPAAQDTLEFLQRVKHFKHDGHLKKF